ncbi:uncharacterized protein, partial [Clytia hemisphaerica]|uniref:uncharacterized protein n=1 Tax=Clytia hemisphaerica TaxID=252671 RepID=UPI0034D50BF8
MKKLAEEILFEDWKLAHVTPIYKNKVGHNLAVNYETVSLTPVVCKLMELILRDHMTNHLTHWIGNHGFISRRSIVTQLLNRYIDKCCEMLMEELWIYFDFAK